MPVPSRRTFAGVLWFCGMAIATGGGMYITIPSVPAYPERTLLLSAAESTDDSQTPSAPLDPSPSVQDAVPTMKDASVNSPPSEPPPVKASTTHLRNQTLRKKMNL